MYHLCVRCVLEPLGCFGFLFSCGPHFVPCFDSSGLGDASVMAISLVLIHRLVASSVAKDVASGWREREIMLKWKRKHWNFAPKRSASNMAIKY